jgi:hypothetical protein
MTDSRTGQEIYKINLAHPVAPESKEVFTKATELSNTHILMGDQRSTGAN